MNLRVPDYLKADDWATNAAGFRFSRFFRFGLMDAGAMTKLAKIWNTVPPQEHCSVDKQEFSEEVLGNSERKFKVVIIDCLGQVNYLEHVQLKVINHKLLGQQIT